MIIPPNTAPGMDPIPPDTAMAQVGGDTVVLRKQSRFVSAYNGLLMKLDYTTVITPAGVILKIVPKPPALPPAAVEP